MRNTNRRVPKNENDSSSSHSIKKNRGEESMTRLEEQVVEKQEIINNLLNLRVEPQREELVLEQERLERKKAWIQARIE